MIDIDNAANSDTMKKKILLIDDDDIQLSYAQSLLKDEYNIVLASSGKEALEKLSQGLVPDLILFNPKNIANYI
jgi:putative two-component system response regulator